MTVGFGDISQFPCLAGEDAGYIIRIITSGNIGSNNSNPNTLSINLFFMSNSLLFNFIVSLCRFGSAMRQW